jgi:hypothetical protein
MSYTTNSRVRRGGLWYMGALVALTACASASLSPAPDARTIAGATNVAVGEVDGVRITVQADAWDGDYHVANAVQPMRVTITNGSKESLRVRYGDFALIAANGHRHGALPPYKVEGDLLQPMMANTYMPIITPAFGYRRFFIAPYFARLYPGIPAYVRGYPLYDPGYYAYYHQAFVQSIRPTVEMLGRAMPEGVIESDGQLSGFLYFERADPKWTSLTFRATLVAVRDGAAPTGGEAFGEISILFTVTKVQ